MTDGYEPEPEDWVCPTCRGRRTIQPDRNIPPEPCPRCVDPDAEEVRDQYPKLYESAPPSEWSSPDAVFTLPEQHQ